MVAVVFSPFSLSSSSCHHLLLFPYSSSNVTCLQFLRIHIQLFSSRRRSSFSSVSFRLEQLTSGYLGFDIYERVLKGRIGVCSLCFCFSAARNELISFHKKYKKKRTKGRAVRCLWFTDRVPQGWKDNAAGYGLARCGKPPDKTQKRHSGCVLGPR